MYSQWSGARLKRTFFLWLMMVLLCGYSFGCAEAENAPVDFGAVFESMSVEELKATQEILESTLNKKIVENATLQLSPAEASVATGKTLKLAVACDGREITKKTDITYTSSNEAVATVSKGTVKGVEAGEAVITATATFEDGGVLSAQCTVTVYVPVSSIKLESKSLSVLVGQTIDLGTVASVAPENATERGLTYEVSDADLAEVDINGLLTGKKAGDTTITITSNEQVEKPKRTTLKVSVLQPVETITLGESSFDVGRNLSYQVDYTITPSDASNQKVVWSSADPKIAKVSSKGVVTGVGTGTTTITCTSSDGSEVAATATVTVITAVKKVAFDEKSLAITAGNDTRISVAVTPEDATNPTLKWSNSDTSVATVSADGALKAVASGECTITAEATDGSGAQASITVYVEPQLPLVVSSIFWQTTWGWKNGKMGIEVDSLCINRKIKSFDYTVKCYNYNDSDPAVTYLTYNGPTISPEKSGKSKLSEYVVGGFATAYMVEITPTKVYYTDGTSEDIPVIYQYTSSFTL